MRESARRKNSTKRRKRVLGTLPCARASEADDRLGLSLRLVARRAGLREHDLASVMYLAAGLLFRFAWVYAGQASGTETPRSPRW